MSTSNAAARISASYLIRPRTGRVVSASSSNALRLAPTPVRRCMLLWIFLSAAVILLNKYILSVAGFPYPIALTCSHMAFGAALSWAMVKGGLVEASPLSMDTYTT